MSWLCVRCAQPRYYYYSGGAPVNSTAADIFLLHKLLWPKLTHVHQRSPTTSSKLGKSKQTRNFSFILNLHLISALSISRLVCVLVYLSLEASKIKKSPDKPKDIKNKYFFDRMMEYKKLDKTKKRFFIVDCVPWISAHLLHRASLKKFTSSIGRHQIKFWRHNQKMKRVEMRRHKNKQCAARRCVTIVTPNFTSARFWKPQKPKPNFFLFLDTTMWCPKIFNHAMTCSSTTLMTALTFFFFLWFFCND